MTDDSNNEKLLEALQRLGADKQPIEITCNKFQMYCVLSALQMATRNPNWEGPVRDSVIAWTKEVAEPFFANEPDLRLLFAMGWEKTFDVPK